MLQIGGGMPVPHAFVMRWVPWQLRSSCAPQRDDGQALTTFEVTHVELELHASPSLHRLRGALRRLDRELSIRLLSGGLGDASSKRKSSGARAGWLQNNKSNSSCS